MRTDTTNLPDAVAECFLCSTSIIYWQFMTVLPSPPSLNHIDDSKHWMLKRKINPQNMSMGQKEKIEVVLVLEFSISHPWSQNRKLHFFLEWDMARVVI